MPGPCGHVNPMKTTLLTALLLSALAIAGTASACPVDDAVDTVTGVATCVASIPGPDGDDEQVRNVDTGVDVVDQDHPCTT